MNTFKLGAAVIVTAALLAAATIQGDLSVLGNLLLTGKADAAVGSVNDDDCTGEQGWFWYDSTDSAFEFCNANSGAPAVLGGGGGAGRSLWKVTWGLIQSGGSFGSLPYAIGCKIDGTITSSSGTGMLRNGAPYMNATSNEGYECRGFRIPTGVDLTNLAFSVSAGETTDNTDTWDIELYVQCLADGETFGSFSTEHAAVTLTSAAGTTDRQMIGVDTTLDLSSACVVGDVLYARVQVGSGGTSTGDVVILSTEIYEQ